VRVRQARLRNEYAAWYPTIAVITWTPAATVARAVARQLLQGEPPWALGPRWAVGPRLLDDRHFEFRGGSEDRLPTSRTRREDQAEAEPGTQRTPDTAAGDAPVERDRSA
jgi:hypothetical protein